MTKKKPDALWIQSPVLGAERVCPACAHPMDATTAVTAAHPGRPLSPEPGDRMICAYCSALLVMQPDGTPRVATSAEVQALPGWIQALVAQGPLLAPFKKTRPQ